MASSNYLYVILPITSRMQIRFQAEAGENHGAPGYVDICHWRRSPQSIDPGDFHRIGAGVRVRIDRIGDFLGALTELADKAEKQGVWAPRRIT